MPYNLREGFPLQQVIGEILSQTQTQRDFTLPMTEVAEAYQGGSLIATDDGDYVLTNQGFTQLCNRLGYSAGALGELEEAPELQRQVVAYMAGRKQGALLMRTNQHEIDSVLSSEYIPIKNSSIAVALDTIFGEDSAARVHRWDLSRGGRVLDMRVLHPDWEFNLSGNGARDPALAGIHITNDETGKGRIVVRTALSRVACFNYTISSDTVFDSEHRYTTYPEFRNALAAGVGQVQTFAGELAERLRFFRTVPIHDVELAFQRIGEKLGVPQYALADAQEYWQQNGGEHNLFHVVQAVQWGARRFTEDTGKRRRQWAARTRVESDLYSLATEIEAHGEEHLLECPACHRPVEVN